MRFNQNQVNLLARYFADLSKIIFGSVVVGYFIPNAVGFINFSTFVLGSGFATTLVVFSVNILKEKQ